MKPPPITARAPIRDFATDTLVEVPGFGTCRRIDMYETWVCAQAEVDLAFRAWAQADAAERCERQRVYRAALDREHQAAVALTAALRAPAVGR